MHPKGTSKDHFFTSRLGMYFGILTYWSWPRTARQYNATELTAANLIDFAAVGELEVLSSSVGGNRKRLLQQPVRWSKCMLAQEISI
jgi:hypothetical protein